MKLLTFSILFFVSYFAVYPAETEIRIADKKTKKYLPSATVQLKCLDGNCKDSVFYKKSDSKGAIKVPSDANLKVKITYIGYKIFDETVKTDKDKTIYLTPVSILLDEIVTTGQYMPNSAKNSVFPVKVVTAERIASQSAINLRDLLSNEMSVRLDQDNILGSSLSINGISGQNVKIMIDGVPVIGRLNGNIDLSQINLSDAERVEIIEGPMSAVYGTDALGGVINIITKNPSSKGFSAFGKYYVEPVGKIGDSFGDHIVYKSNHNVDGEINYSFGDNVISVNGGRNFFGGWNDPDTSRSQQWKPREQYFGGIGFYRDFGLYKFRYTGDFMYDYILNKGQPRPPYFEKAFDDHYKTLRITNSIFSHMNFGTDKAVDLTFSYSIYERQKNTFFKDLVTLDEKLTSDPSDQDTTKFSSFLVRTSFVHDKVADYLSYQLGTEINIENAEGKKIENKIKEVGDYALYAGFQYMPLGGMIIQPTVRFIYNTQYDAPLVPSVNLKYDLLENLKLRGSYARGFRAPSLKELYFLFVDVNHNIRGNDNLKAETSNSFNISADYTLELSENVFRVTPKFFFNDIDNLISLANVESDLYSYINIGRYKTLGYSLNTQYFDKTITAGLGLSYIGRSNDVGGSGLVPSYSYTPELQANIIYKIPFFDVKLAAFYKYTGELPGYSVTDEETMEIRSYKISDYSMMDITLTKNFDDNLIEMGVGVKNLFDVTDVAIKGSMGSGEDYTEFASERPVGWGRTFFLTMKINVD